MSFFWFGGRKRQQEKEEAEARAAEDRRLGDILIRKSTCSWDHVAEAAEKQKKTGKKLGEQLVELGYCQQEDVDCALREQKAHASLDELDKAVTRSKTNANNLEKVTTSALRAADVRAELERKEKTERTIEVFRVAMGDG